MRTSRQGGERPSRKENRTLTISEREARRNFALGLFNGTTFRFAETLIDPPLVLTWFVE